MSAAYKKRAKLRRQSEAVSSWPDIFEDNESTRAIECHHGDRVSTAHIRQFEKATEEIVLRIWGENASTTEIVQNWDNFILGRLLDITRLESDYRKESQPQPPLSTESGQTLNSEPCETCLRNTASLFASTLQVSKVSSESTTSTPNISRPGTPTAFSTGTTTRKETQKRLSKPLRIWALDTLDLRIYVTSAYIRLLRSSPLSICRDCPSIYTSLYLKFNPSEASLFPPCSNPDQHLSVYTLLLASDSQNLLSTENAGGSSIESEVLSFEVLKRIMPYWELSTMEMSTTYASSGPITDYVARSYISPDQEISVSVTRIFGWSSNMKISKSALTPLLIRKLVGLRSATSRILPRRQRGMILFIWVPDGAVEKNVRRVWSKLRDDEVADETRARSRGASKAAYGVNDDVGITQNVILFVAVCEKESWMDTTGWRRVFGKVDRLENEYLDSPAGPQSHRSMPLTPPLSPSLSPLRNVQHRCQRGRVTKSTTSNLCNITTETG
ncbi:protein of unknown function [Taphrina deformans PYCC 5710]|uniref:Uncharacterized protein n=1 Tax=Taphrina deformans (strain PYCC 5710 / ATCC 11124 / CBS 356.35 / IMI 108563 / JCM 9778 / NBRC 8474) TaxID=1097556 RepID=R4XMG2_TAPDE|nr:protein of unknown function [Taphrina deformans PYCC 5710]|eukprot:CCG84495.1 protein of unknown function [Taphrina deformans PYCC 5710]